MMKEEQLVNCPCCDSILGINSEGLAHVCEWWELLLWDTMPETFKKLPPEIRNEIRIKFPNLNL